MSHDPHHTLHQPTIAMDEQPDSWHMHTVDEGLPQEEHAAQADSRTLVVAFLGSVFFVGAVIVVCLLYYGTHTTALRMARIETTALSEDYVKYRDESDRVLSSYHWGSSELAAAGKVTIPLDQAIQKAMQQYGADTGGNR